MNSFCKVVDGLIGMTCYAVRTGYVNVGFIGFGQLTVNPIMSSAKSIPHWEFQTVFSQWWVEQNHKRKGSSKQTGSRPQQALETLVDKKLERIDFEQSSLNLHLSFEGELGLFIKPYTSKRNMEVWCLSSVDGIAYVGYSNGEILLQSIHDPLA